MKRRHLIYALFALDAVFMVSQVVRHPNEDLTLLGVSALLTAIGFTMMLMGDRRDRSRPAARKTPR